MLRKDQIERYQRHILLKEIGGAGQQKLLNARILVIGVGGLGSILVTYLVAAGIGTIGIIDDDKVTLSNLQRQVLYRMSDLDTLKVIAAKNHLNQLNPDCDIKTYIAKLTVDNAMNIIHQYDIIVDACDNFPTRFLINDACYFAKKPLISAAISQFNGQISTFRAFEKDSTGQNLPCYRSFIPHPPDSTDMPDCSEIGVLGALTGIMGSLQAMEIIKEVTGIGESLAGRLMIYNGLSSNIRVIKLPWDPENPLNGLNPSLHNLSHHQ